MNHIARRMIAGVSATALFVSAVGFDVFDEELVKPVSAVSTIAGSSGKNGRSTGFPDPEQDTDKDGYYNTGYGLHTNKTATAVDDGTGRTFDVDLESWYVGENPVDVATVLDASGSMAWTVDTLDPLELDEKQTAELKKEQEANGGYLTEDTVEKILDPENTDNTKLSYAGYKYYVYEARSSVAEFVPLGYWDGGIDPKNDPSLIGYYPFSGDLKNKARGHEGSATLINHPTGDDAYDPNAPITKEVKAEFYTEVSTDKEGNKKSKEKGLNIRDTAKVGGVLLKKPTTSKFSIKLNVSKGSLITKENQNNYGNTTFLYITDGTNKYKIYRAGGGSSNRMKISENGSDIVNGNNIFKDSNDQPWTFTFDFENSKLQMTYTNGSVAWNTPSSPAISTEGAYKTIEVNLPNASKFDMDKLQIIVGGADSSDEVEKFSDVYVKDVSITEYHKSAEAVAAPAKVSEPEIIEPETTETKPAEFTEPEIAEPETTETKLAESAEPEITEPETTPAESTELTITELETIAEPEKFTESKPISDPAPTPLAIAAEETEKEIANYSFTKDLSNTVESSDPAVMVYQLYEEKAGEKIESLSVDPVIKDKKYLDVKETSKLGAVCLDAVPDIDNSEGFTISMKLQRTNSLKNNCQNIFYLGDKNTAKGEYYQFFRSKDAGGYLGLSKGNQDDFESGTPSGSDKVYYKGGMANNNWYTNTLVFKPDPKNKDKMIVTPYINGKAEYQDKNINTSIGSISVNKSDLVFLLGAIQKNDSNSDQYLDDLYVFNTALSPEKVNMYFSGGSVSCEVDDSTHAQSIVKNEDGTETIIEIAQIAKTKDDDKSSYNGRKRLADNTNADQRRGWYYVNSHSEWNDIKGCLESGKQYIGILTERPSGNDKKKGEDYYDHSDKATVPPGLTDSASITAGNTNSVKYVPPTTERSIRFYVDSQNHLRCFVWSGNDSTDKETDARTFCSIVYEKKIKEDKEIQKTKYEELNSALNTFYGNLATNSDLSNTAIVRFSTINAVDKDTETTTNENLKKLIMKNWTNWSDAVLKESQTDKSTYLNDLLIPADGETAVPPDGSTEYPYVMTGGTYTWTGLKSFYDNMVKKDDLESGDKVYDVANDARDKYLIIFTDGRDNTVGSSDKKYCGTYSPKGHTAENDAGLAGAWADKLKDEGYTIYCVMLATGSISEDTNPGEFNSAKEFLTTLAGSNKLEEQLAKLQEQLKEENDKTYPDSKVIDSLKDQIEQTEAAIKEDPGKHVIIASPTTSGTNTITEAFDKILKDIQQPRADYTVQDYIDPRFDLVDASGNIYHLGANGRITIEYSPDRKSTTTVGDIIDNPTAYGYPYTPQSSNMVNRTLEYDEKENREYYNDGDGIGTGYIYYDDDKDMYYLRWEDQVIPMENESFDTSKENPKTLDVWSATIRLKAKDDFIGGNNILTNGNEAGENLVYSEATIENMDKNPTLYFSDGKEDHTLREKLQILSGTNRKINAVDAGNVSQAVYGDGIDIPSSGFPRVTVNVRLLKLNAKNLNDVIYMGEVISPTMMLADLEDGYMTGSYYLQYLERYAYRIYGEGADDMPLIELLNKWLKIDDENEASKTFTIPYIYLPDPEYTDDGKLEKDSSGKVIIQNSTGADKDKTDEEIFADLNLRDVTGFITYTWKREDKDIDGDGKPDHEEQQKMEEPDKEGNDQYDITKEYVVKNTNQIKYNLQLKFTPLKEGELKGFTLDNNFIKADATTRTGGDKFFKVEGKEFGEATEWSIESNRSDYLQAMVKEQHSYTPHVDYDGSTQKWILKNGEAVSDKDTYDWNSEYKPVVDEEQIVSDKLTDYYTDTPDNVELDAYSLIANTTYIKDVVNGALALELVVDGKYLGDDSPIKAKDKTYTFEATRYYDDPLDKLPYGDKTDMYADTGAPDTTTGVKGKKYQLTFKVDENTLPKAPKANRPETIWATLSEVKVYDGTSYVSITEKATETNKYTGYSVKNALPIGTYVISTKDENNSLTNEQFKIGIEGSESVNFAYLKLDNADASYTYDRFPENVYKVSGDAATDTKDGEYLIKNGGTDNSKKNKADNNRVKDADNNQTLTFYLGTVNSKTVDKTLVKNTKGYDRTDKANSDKDYAKDRLGIIMLSKNNNSLSISKTVTNTEVTANRERLWEFKVEFTPKAGEDSTNFETQNKDGFSLKWYDSKGDLLTGSGYAATATFTSETDGSYTTTLSLKHGESVRIENLPEGTWQVVETDKRSEVFYSAHNNMDNVDEYSWSNETSKDIQLNPASHVDFVNEFPHELPSTGGQGTHKIIYAGVILAASASLYFLFAYRRFRRRRKEA